jgi:hypothetical protein
MTNFLDDLQSVGLTALFNPTFLFLLILLFFLGRLVGWLTRGLSIWKYLALAYFGVFLFRPLQDAGIVIGGVFILGVASMYLDLFRGIFRWAGNFSDVFFAFRDPGVYREINRLEKELADVRRELRMAQAADGGGQNGQSATQQNWRKQARARAAASNHSPSSGDSGRGAGTGRSSRSSNARKASSKSQRHVKSGSQGIKGQGKTSRPRSSDKSQSRTNRTSNTKARSSRSGSSSQQTSSRPGSAGQSQTKQSTSQKSYSSKQSGTGQHSGASQNQNGSSQGSGQSSPGVSLSPALRDRYLQTLELSPGQNYSGPELKAAWRTMAFKTHPDRGGSAAAFSEAFAAYKALTK